jgi:serine/threonine-protein kinase
VTRLCPTCGARFENAASRCPFDASELVEASDAHVGTTLGGRYTLTSRLDEGATGTVYRATDTRDGRTVAVKLLAPALVADPIFIERFRREREALAALRHPHVVDVYDADIEGDRAWLVMELLDGETLGARLRRGRLAPAEALEVCAQTASALATMHEAGMIHRDVKPANLFLCRAEDTSRARVKVLDFGFVRLRDATTLTASGQVVGTPEYMAPEQIQGLRCTAASDLYALGVVLFEMLTGGVPFRGSLTELFMLHAQASAPRPSTLNPSVPVTLDALVAKLLAKDPSLRPRDARRVLPEIDALRNALASK